MMPAEPGALIKYMRTQICTFCQSGGGFPTENKGLGFPKPSPELQPRNKNLIFTQNNNLYHNQPLQMDKSSDFCLDDEKR